jgi:NADH-quinone oxidoreductase subunit G
MHGSLIRTAPGEEAPALRALTDLGPETVILVGERLATVPGALSAALEVSRATGAKLAWVPRRAGERGALETGCLPNLLPGGRPVEDASARVDLGTVWGSTVPNAVGRDGNAIVAAAAAGELKGLVVGGVDTADLPDPALAARAVQAAEFVVSLEIRESSVTEHADVVLPVAPVTEKSGMYVDWEGRPRPFDKVLRDSNALPDLRVLAGIADELGVDLGFKTVEQARREMEEIGAWDGTRAELSASDTAIAEQASDNSALRLATWKLLVDDGRMLDGEEYLKATGRRPVALVSETTLAELGLTGGQRVTLSGWSSSTTLPVAVADLPDGVVWAPTTRAWGHPGGTAVRLAPADESEIGGRL